MVYCSAAVTLLKFMVTCNVISHVECFVLYVITFCNICSIPNIAVFCSSLISYSTSMLFRYCVNDFKMVPIAPVITGITFVFASYMR
jgi:hypothetical protein